MITSKEVKTIFKKLGVQIGKGTEPLLERAILKAFTLMAMSARKKNIKRLTPELVPYVMPLKIYMSDVIK